MTLYKNILFLLILIIQRPSPVPLVFINNLDSVTSNPTNPDEKPRKCQDCQLQIQKETTGACYKHIDWLEHDRFGKFQRVSDPMWYY